MKTMLKTVDSPVARRPGARPSRQKIERLAESKYEAPKVVAFNFGRPMAKVNAPQITMAGNF
jgi:hypothetical protein